MPQHHLTSPGPFAQDLPEKAAGPHPCAIHVGQPRHPHVGQILTVEDADLRGTERVAFEPGPNETRITLTLEVEPKDRIAPLRKFLLRRRLGESLKRTLTRFSHELAAERQFGRSR